MAKYIKCEAALAMIRPDDPNDERCAVTVATAKRLIRHALTAAPAADVAPVVHGRWDDSGRYTFPGGSTAVRCTKCGCALTESEYHLQNWNYCPVCGAKMGGGDSDEAD